MLHKNAIANSVELFLQSHPNVTETFDENLRFLLHQKWRTFRNPDQSFNPRSTLDPLQVPANKIIYRTTLYTYLRPTIHDQVEIYQFEVSHYRR